MNDDVTIPREEARRIAQVLRDEVAEIVRTKNSGHRDSHYNEQANVILNAARKRIEVLPVMHVHNNEWLRRDDVLALLGESDE